MHYSAQANDHGLPYNPFKAIIAPRPIGWITTLDAHGTVNCAPYSFFNAVSAHPPMVAFSSEGMKDSAFLAAQSGEFTCSFVSLPLAQQMVATATPLPRGEDETRLAGLETSASRFVKPPRVKGSPAAVECRWLRTIPLESASGDISNFLVVGEVVGVYIDDAFICDGIVDTAAMQPVMRAGYDSYFSVGPEQAFQLSTKS